MSPTDRVGGEAHGATRAVVADGQEVTNDHELEKKSAVPVAALNKMLAMLGDGWNPRSPDKSDENGRTPWSRVSSVRFWEQVQA